MNETITICGRGFNIPVPDKYTAGATLVLTDGEASSIRQTFCENVRNNIAGKIKKTLGENETVLPEAALAEWQTKVDEYAGTYAFGVRTGGGGRLPVDPELREALTLVKEAIKVALVDKYGPKHGRTEAQVREAAQRAFDANPDRWTREARTNLRRRREAAGNILEGMEEAA